jgi:hypothetical protein
MTDAPEEHVDKIRRALARAESLADLWSGDTTPITRSEASDLLTEVLKLSGWTQADPDPRPRLQAVPDGPVV